jgi:hypothetical protein
MPPRLLICRRKTAGDDEGINVTDRAVEPSPRTLTSKHRKPEVGDSVRKTMEQVSQLCNGAATHWRSEPILNADVTPFRRDYSLQTPFWQFIPPKMHVLPIQTYLDLTA